jgi:putative ABC transport system permease protein
MSTRRRPDEDLDREIRAHLEIEAEQLIDEGAPPETAHTTARRAFGNVTSIKERLYEARRLVWLDQLRQDARCGVRSLRRYPVAAAVAVISLAGGIGATTVTLMIRDVVFRRPPLLYVEPAQLSRVQVGSPDRPLMPLGSPVPAALYSVWREELGDGIAGAAYSRVRDVRTDDRAEPLAVRPVTPHLFTLLGVRPEVGQFFTPSDRAVARGDQPAGGGGSIVLSYRAWMRLFDARADAIGRVVWIDNRPHIVAGVLPARFWFSSMDSPIWTPMHVESLPPDEGLDVIVRRPPGMTPAVLDARLQAGLAQYVRQLPAGQRERRLKVSGVEGTPIGHQVAFVLPYVLAASVVLTLLIACANVAILMIAQWTAREHEIAIRASIGASRGRIVRTLLTESVVLAAFGGASGVAATLLLRSWIIVRAGNDVGMFDLSLDAAILVKAIAITLLTGVLAGVGPALYETRRLHVNPLRTIASSDRVRQRWRHALVVMEITVTVALLVVTGAMVEGYFRTKTADMGFAPSPLLAASVENDAGVTPAPVLDVLRGVPGVAAAAATTGVPYTGGGRQEVAAADASGTTAIRTTRTDISGEFFATLGVPMVAGRPFSNHDTPSARVAIVNETLARRLFPGRAPVGERVWTGGNAHEIVGVVADYADSPQQVRSPVAKIFLPLAVDARVARRLRFLVRANGEAAPLVATVRKEIRGASAGTAAVSVHTFDQIITIIGQEMLVGTAPLFPLIAIGTLLTAAGIYGVLSFAITRRSRELAVRIAVGATGRDVVTLVTAHTVRLAAIGMLLGTGATFALARVVRASGGAGGIFDPPIPVFVVTLLVVAAIAALATWIPARRALRIDPSILLRNT